MYCSTRKMLTDRIGRFNKIPKAFIRKIVRKTFMKNPRVSWPYSDDNIKTITSRDYNLDFNKNTGAMIRFGRTLDHDPKFSPFGPEIADIEITTKCKGPQGKLCKFCYKNNTPNKGENMSLETFKRIIDKYPFPLTQVAFGVDSDCSSNPEWYDIFKYCREKGYIPNTTISDCNEDLAKKLASVCGAVSVSRYDDKELCYTGVSNLKKAGLKQVNIHIMISEETFGQVKETVDDYLCNFMNLKDNVNAIVLLGLKQKGRGVGYHKLNFEKFKTLVNYCLENDVPLGFDSCCANKFLKSVEDSPKYNLYNLSCEPCESGLFSSYINVKGEFFPCSFVEGSSGWESGISVVNCGDFLKDVWFNSRVIEWQKRLLNNNRSCPVYDV